MQEIQAKICKKYMHRFARSREEAGVDGLGHGWTGGPGKDKING